MGLTAKLVLLSSTFLLLAVGFTGLTLWRWHEFAKDSAYLLEHDELIVEDTLKAEVELKLQVQA